MKPRPLTLLFISGMTLLLFTLLTVLFPSMPTDIPPILFETVGTAVLMFVFGYSKKIALPILMLVGGIAAMTFDPFVWGIFGINKTLLFSILLNGAVLSASLPFSVVGYYTSKKFPLLL